MSGSLSSRLQDTFASSSRVPLTPASKPAKKRTPPVSIRFSDDVRALLEKRAGDQPLGGYVRDIVLLHLGRKQRRRNGASTGEQQAIARTLRRMGQSGVAGVLHSLILAVEEGRLPMDKQDVRDLRRAIADVAAIRSDLVEALGLRDGA